MKVLVTGASGFIGSHVVLVLKANGHHVVAASRSPLPLDGVEWRAAPDLGPHADWSYCLAGVDVVVHLAAYAHVTSKTKVDHALLKQTNVVGAANLARQAAQVGVTHFVFLSSIGAMADSSDHALTIGSPCRPMTPYGASKLDAEKVIKDEAKLRGMEWTILRAPLVYGPGNPGNMRRLLKLVQSGIPLPFASVRNRRSFIYVENFTDVIAICLGNPLAFGRTFLPSDGEDVSTPQLIRAIARAAQSVEEVRRGKIGDGLDTRYAFGRHSDPSAAQPTVHATRYSARLFPFPESVLKALGRLPGLGALRKLTSSLYIDSEPLHRDLGWTPPFTMAEGLRRTLAGVEREQRKERSLPKTNLTDPTVRR